MVLNSATNVYMKIEAVVLATAHLVVLGPQPEFFFFRLHGLAPRQAGVTPRVPLVAAAHFVLQLLAVHHPDRADPLLYHPRAGPCCLLCST